MASDDRRRDSILKIIQIRLQSMNCPACDEHDWETFLRKPGKVRCKKCGCVIEPSVRFFE